LTIEGSHSFIANGIVVHNTLPKVTKWAKPLRKAFIAPKGYKVCNLDYSQGELRIAACLSNEPVMLEAYNKGLDLHAVTGAGLAGIELQEFLSYKDHADKDKAAIYDNNRQSAKGANFGLLYGMGVDGYREYAATSYGNIMTKEQAETNRDRFFDTYKALIPWHERYKAFALKYGYINSPLGRVRHLPLINSSDRMVRSKELRRAVNSPVQGCLSDMSLWATAIMHKQGLLDKAPCVAMIHDALVFYLPEDNWEYYAKEYKNIMENLPFEQVGWEPQCKFLVDVETGESMGALKKVKNLG
jgi:DNA polymerase I-like protein with 3'-5' exonuclease and polymerase domains